MRAEHAGSPLPTPRRPDLPAPSSRRTVLRAAGTVSVLGALGIGGHQAYRRLRPAVDPHTEIGLSSRTVAFDENGQRLLIPAGPSDHHLAPGTRLTVHAARDAVLDAPPPHSPAAKAASFLAVAQPWRSTVPPEFASLADSALADLWVLSQDLPAPVAAWTPYWRYVWPRDTAFCAVALARIGHVDRALEALTHLQSIQPSDGWFEARYVPGTNEAPDGRARQFDGTGLLLWATREVADAAGSERRAQITSRLGQLIETSQHLLVEQTRHGERMPPVSPDYWEVGEHSVTLAIMASTLTGLRSAAALTGEQRTAQAADAFTTLLTGAFGPAGFQRYRRRGGADSARAFFDATGCHQIIPASLLTSLRTELERPGGGIAPGASWRQDGISWTPSTSLLALALARSGQSAPAREILTWVAEHRTEAGSIPEKVLFDGRPAAVAPLAWSAANVILTLDALDRG